MNIFQGEGVLFVSKETVVNMWGGINPGEKTTYHMCKSWLKKVHGGWDMGGG